MIISQRHRLRVPIFKRHVISLLSAAILIMLSWRQSAPELIIINSQNRSDALVTNGTSEGAAGVADTLDPSYEAGKSIEKSSKRLKKMTYTVNRERGEYLTNVVKRAANRGSESENVVRMAENQEREYEQTRERRRPRVTIQRIEAKPRTKPLETTEFITPVEPKIPERKVSFTLEGSGHKMKQMGMKQNQKLGALVILAPSRHASSMWGVSRFCLLLNAVKSADRNLNIAHGPYDIFIVVPNDFNVDVDGDGKPDDAPYTEQDRALIRSVAPHSRVKFIPINIYTKENLEPNVTFAEFKDWSRKSGRISFGYAGMCRLFSGYLQNMPFLADYKYYMRMDDDSMFTRPWEYDPFMRMETQNLQYLFRRISMEFRGIQALWNVTWPHVWRETAKGGRSEKNIPFTRGGHYSGREPYNNFHIAPVSFWSTPEWKAIMKDMDEKRIFYQYGAGDANVHAVAIMMMEAMSPIKSRRVWREDMRIPYGHNSNDLGQLWVTPGMKSLCEEGFRKFNTT